MKLSKLVLYGAGTVMVAAVVGIFAAPKVSAAVRGALVEIVIPSKPINESMTVLTSPVSSGPDAGTFGVSNIIVTNFDSSPQQVLIFQPVIASGGSAGCGGAVLGGGGPRLIVYVQSRQTLVIPYPTPLVFSGINGHSCIAAQILTTPVNGGFVEVDVNGFVN
jgi:hypothetical protein